MSRQGIDDTELMAVFETLPPMRVADELNWTCYRAEEGTVVYTSEFRAITVSIVDARQDERIFGHHSLPFSVHALGLSRNFGTLEETVHDAERVVHLIEVCYRCAVDREAK